MCVRVCMCVKGKEVGGCMCVRVCMCVKGKEGGGGESGER